MITPSMGGSFLLLQRHKGHVVTVEIDKNGNLIYDGVEFKREFIRIIDPALIPEAYLESSK